METRSKDAEFQKLKAEAEELGLSGKDIVEYIREERKRAEEAKETEQNRLEREAEHKRRAELEAKQLELEQETELKRLELEANERAAIRAHELDMTRVQLNTNTNHNNHGEGDTQGDRSRSDKYKIRLPYFDDKDDLESYMVTFERTARLQEWPEEEWAPRLGTLLKGRARDIYCKMNEEDANNYTTLKQALFARFRLTADEYKRKFQSARKAPHETIQEFSTRVESFFDRWVELTGKAKEYDALRDLILQDKFLDGIPYDQARFVKEGQPESLSEAVDKAVVYDSARAGRRTTPFDAHHNKGGNKEDKGKENGKGQNNSNSDSGGSSRGGDRTSGCFKCGGPHMARNCGKGKPQMARSVRCSRGVEQPAYPQQTLCPTCEAKPYSPHCKVIVEGLEADATRDTGASITVVDAQIVPERCMLGKTQNVTLASGQTLELPLARVALDTPYFVGKTEVVVMKKPVGQVLIGNRRKTETGEIEQIPVYPVAEKCANVETRSSKTKNDMKTLKVSGTKIAGITPEQLMQEQKQDPTLADARKKADENGRVDGGSKKKKNSNYFWKRNVLYRSHENKSGKITSQVVVPKKFREEVMRLAHDTPMAGHLGVSKTRARIWSDFAWPGICGDVRRYCASCDVCQRSATKGSQKKAPLGKMPIIDTPFERVAVDIIGPLIPASDRGYRYVLTMIDYATRYVEAKPLKTTKTEEVVENMWEMWTRLGVPKEVLTDRGTNFVGDLSTEMNRLLGIKGIRTSPRHAQCNGLVEKMNGTLKAMIRRLCQEQPKEWDRFIPALLFAYREVPQESLQFSPFELLYGRTVRGPMQILRELLTEEEVPEETRTTFEYVANLRNRIESTCKIAHESLAKAAKKQAKYFNKSAQQRKLAIGDQVLILQPERQNKMQLSWKGPYVVTDRIGDGNYRVQINDKEKLYHINMLKRYIVRNTEEEGEEVHIVAVVMHDDEESSQETRQGSTIPMLVLQRTEGPQQVVKANTLTSTQKSQLDELCEKYSAALSDLPGDTHLAECEIQQVETEPVFVRQYPLPHSKIETVKKEVHSMLEMGVIEPSASPYSAPVVLVQKKDGNVRFCIDYRKLNQSTKFDAEPLPDINHLFTKLSGKKYFSKIDLTKGYWQIPMKGKDKEKTAFTTPDGQYQWKKMPFGLKNAGAVFSRMMRKLLLPLDQDQVSNFIDDILIASETWEQHLAVVEDVLVRIQDCGLTAKPSKCCLGFDSLTFLGHRIEAGHLLPEEDKVEKIRNAARPKTKKELRSFLGLAGYYRKFVPNFAIVAKSLTDRTKKGHPEKVEWNVECEQAFDSLKEHLSQKPVIRLPDPSKEYTLRTDASDTGLGAVLLQDQGEGLQPIAYASKKLNGAETRYSTIEKECMAVVWGVKKFEPYIYGTHFTLETDHRPLQYLNRSKTENGRLMRWAIQLQQHNFTVKVIPGRDNVGADYLSRSTS